MLQINKAAAEQARQEEKVRREEDQARREERVVCVSCRRPDLPLTDCMAEGWRA
jgi:hypothetical protein